MGGLIAMTAKQVGIGDAASGRDPKFTVDDSTSIDRRGYRFGGRGDLVFELGCGFADRFTVVHHGFTHFFAGLELHHGSGRDGDIGFGGVGIAAHTCLAKFDFEDTKVSEFDGFAASDGIADVIQGLLNHIENLLLHQAGFVGNADYEVPFGNVFGHVSIGVLTEWTLIQAFFYKPLSNNGQERVAWSEPVSRTAAN